MCSPFFKWTQLKNSVIVFIATCLNRDPENLWKQLHFALFMIMYVCRYLMCSRQSLRSNEPITNLCMYIVPVRKETVQRDSVQNQTNGRCVILQTRPTAIMPPKTRTADSNAADSKAANLKTAKDPPVFAVYVVSRSVLAKMKSSFALVLAKGGSIGTVRV